MTQNMDSVSKTLPAFAAGVCWAGPGTLGGTVWRGCCARDGGQPLALLCAWLDIDRLQLVDLGAARTNALMTLKLAVLHALPSV